MKKICFITTVSLTLRTFVLDTAVYLHEHGDYDITFICDRDDKFAESLPDYIHYIPVPMARGINLSGFSAIRAFKKIFREHRFDIVQYATPNASLYASIAAKATGIPVRLYAQWGIRYVGFSGVMRKVFKTLEKTVCRRSTAIRAVSPMNMAFAVEEGLYPPKKARVLGRGGTIGVRLEEYPLDRKPVWREAVRARHGMTEDFTYGFSGRLSRDKGGNELLRAFKALSERHPAVNLLIVGPDEAGRDVDAEFLSWAKSNPHVVFTGMVPKTDMPRYYAAMDALVHPTYREGFGMVLQEAGAMALPVLTTDIPGASEVLERDVSCLLCDAQNTDVLLGQMEVLLDPATGDRLGREARAWVERHYERSLMLERQLADYESL